jgi:hypothetical protein
MDLNSVAYTVILTFLVQGASLGCAIVMALHKEAYGYFKSSMIGGIVLSTLCIFTTIWVLGSRSDLASGKITLLVVLQLISFFVTGSGAVYGLVRPGHQIGNKLAGEKLIDPEKEAEVWKLRDAISTQALSVLACMVGLQLLMCFGLLVANDSLKKLQKANELPRLSLWSSACGDGGSSGSGNGNDYEEDPDYAASGKRKKNKPTFRNSRRKAEHTSEEESASSDGDSIDDDNDRKPLFQAGPRRGHVV